MSEPIHPTTEKRPIPKWFLQQEGLTTRDWKARKRRELRRLRAALAEFRLGGAYTPLKYGEVGRIGDALAAMKKALSVKEWGR